MQQTKLAAIASLVLFLVGCSVVGKGHRVVIRAACPSPDAKDIESCQYIAAKYPNLISPTFSNSDLRVLSIDPNGSPRDLPVNERQKALDDFSAYLTRKYGSPDFQGVRIAANVYNRNLTPPFLAYDTSAAFATLLGTALPTKKYTVDELVQMRKTIEAQLRNIPDQQEVTVLHDRNNKNQTRYFYYPRIALDFSVQFPSTSSYDRISYLALIISLKQACTDATNTECINIKNFAPKAADIIDFSRGTFTQTAQAQLQAAATLTTSQTDNTAGQAAFPNTAKTSGLSYGPTATGSLTEAYMDTLADQVERRASGYLDAHTVFSELRSVRQIRLAGTYSYDFQLEVPATLNHLLQSEPVLKHVTADIYLIGVVRHVFKRGHKGIIWRVPEIENDDVYEQVVIKIYPNAPLWDAPNAPFREERTCTLKVVTNRDDAAFVVKDIGGGRQTEGIGKVLVTTLSEMETTGTCCADVEFLPIPLGAESTKTLLLKASAIPPGRRILRVGDSETVLGNYNFEAPKPPPNPAKLKKGKERSK